MTEKNDQEVPSNAVDADERGDHTAEMAENQEKTASRAAPATAPKAAPPKAKETVEQALARRIRDIEDLMADKEAHQMAYVYDKIPKPYYRQWKSEANELMALVVSLKLRQRQMKKRKAG